MQYSKIPLFNLHFHAAKRFASNTFRAHAYVSVVIPLPSIKIPRMEFRRKNITFSNVSRFRSFFQDSKEFPQRKAGIPEAGALSIPAPRHHVT